MAALGLQLLGGGISSALGFGGAIGAGIGGLIGNALFGPDTPDIKGPRIQDTKMQSSAYGDPMVRVWGTLRTAGEIVWSSKLKEHERKTKVGGKGFGGQTVSTFFATVDMRVSVCGNVTKGVKEFWFDGRLVYDVGDAPPSGDLIQRITASNLQAKSITIYTGDESQLPDPLEESYVGVGNSPAYRGQTTIVFEDLNLEKFANRRPNMSFTPFTEGQGAAIKEIGRHNIDQGNYRGVFLHVDGNGEIIAPVRDAAQPFDGYTDNGYWLHRVTPSSISRERKIPAPIWGNSSAGYLHGHSDEPGYALFKSGGDISYLSFSEQSETILPRPPNFATFIPIFFAKRGDEAVVNAHGPANANEHSLVVYKGSTAVLTTLEYDSPVHNVRDIGITDDFYYILTGVEGLASIQQLDKGDLSTIQTWALGETFVQKMDVISDDLIYFIRQEEDDGPIGFFKLVDGVVSNLGSVVQSQFTAPGFNCISFAFNAGIFYYQNCGVGGTNMNIFLFAPTVKPDKIALSQIVSDQCVEAGAETDQFEVSELTDLVHGWPRSKQMTARDAIEKLMPLYQFYANVSDWKLKFLKKGKDPVETIKQDDLAAHEFGQEMPSPLTTKVDELGLPRKLTFLYVNPEADYQQGSQTADRLITEVQTVLTVEVPVAMANSEARQRANVMLAAKWLEKTEHETAVGNKYAHLDAGDVIGLEIPS